MKLSEHLKEAISFEEGIVYRINHMLTLLLERTDLPQDVVGEVKGILKILSDESLNHKSIMEGILEEMEGHDKQGHDL